MWCNLRMIDNWGSSSVIESEDDVDDQLFKCLNFQEKTWSNPEKRVIRFK